jgi:hypothetical protein
LNCLTCTNGEMLMKGQNARKEKKKPKKEKEKK